MENAVTDRLRSVKLGEAQTYKHLTIFPLIAAADGQFQYRTLGEAIGNGDVTVTEVSAGGSVPELRLINRGNTPVLVIDGEELAGAKQNRVLNTSILIREVSETNIPVSCTEQGRWSYVSKTFSESGNIMTHRSRSRKTRSVLRSLESSGSYSSDQGEVWGEIAELQAKAGAASPTSAMSDIYKAREEDLRQCAGSFKHVAGQVGLLALIGGFPAGLDMVSLTSAYTRLHPKLVRSYILEGLLDSNEQPAAPDSVLNEARKFLDQIASGEEREFPSIGHGTDRRFKGRGFTGAALVHEGEVIHAAFFRMEQSQEAEPGASYGSRRRYFCE